ncbi:MAG: hypothetical protein IKI58_02525 [Oscillospiraceae bacterium]|nr:hypothetical protein [Oscillospiraceae bacterium]
MKLYFQDQRKLFPFLKTVDIRDEDGNVRYRVKMDKSLHAGLRLNLLDAYDEKIAFIRQKLMTIAPKFFIETNGEQRTVSLKRPLKGGAHCESKETGWRTEGDLIHRNYEIKDGEQQLARIQKVLSGEQQCCGIDLSDDANETEVLTFIIAIEAILSVDSGGYSP